MSRGMPRTGGIMFKLIAGAAAIVDRRLVEHGVLAVAVDTEAEAQHHPAR